MKSTTPAAPADPVLLLIAVVWLAAEALATLLPVSVKHPAVSTLIPPNRCGIGNEKGAPAPRFLLVRLQRLKESEKNPAPNLHPCGVREVPVVPDKRGDLKSELDNKSRI